MASGAVTSKSELMVSVVVGNGECETSPTVYVWLLVSVQGKANRSHSLAHTSRPEGAVLTLRENGFKTNDRMVHVCAAGRSMSFLRDVGPTFGSLDAIQLGSTKPQLPCDPQRDQGVGPIQNVSR